MSRCFPFPPPGYEKKPRPEVADLLKEEKLKEKKHKKDKKEKEKKEGKEKKDRDRSDGKHREKKDKKEKHKEKKDKDKDKKKEKHKDRSKDKPDNSIFVEARVAGLPDGQIREKPHTGGESSRDNSTSTDENRRSGQFDALNRGKPTQNSIPDGQIREKPHRGGEFSKDNSTSTDENRRSAQFDAHNRGKPTQNSIPDGQIREKPHAGGEFSRDNSTSTDENRRSAQFDAHIGGKPIQNSIPDGRIREKPHAGGEFSKDNSTTTDENRRSAQFDTHNRGKPIQNSILTGEGNGRTFFRLGERNKDENVGARSQSVERFSTAEKRDEKTVGIRFSGNMGEEKEQKKEKTANKRKMDEEGLGDESRCRGNAMVQKFTAIPNGQVDPTSRPVEENNDRIINGKENSKEKNDNQRHKSGDKEEKKGPRKDKDRKKDKKKEKAKEKDEHKKKERDEKRKKVQDGFKDVFRNDLAGVLNTKTLHLPKEHTDSVQPEGLGKKRKDIESNGFLHDSGSRPQKLQRPASHPSAENGVKLVTTLIPSSDALDSAVKHHKVDNKERKINGVLDANLSPPPKKKVAPAVTSSDQIPRASRKSDHPDSKYLGQILSVPKMDEWSGTDDQEWLFSGTGSPPKKPKVGSAGFIDEQRVWDGALHIESADIFALPYVIPY